MNRPLLWSMILAAVALALISTVVLPWDWEGVEARDGDVPLRFERVMELRQGGLWYDSIAERLDAPHGELIAWSRPLDLILYVGAAAGSAFTDFRTSLILWGALLSPLLLLSLLPVLQRVLQPVLGPVAVLPATLLLLLQPSFTVIFIVGRADHHSLMALSFVALLLCLIQTAMGDISRRPALIAGTLVGFACWVSIESLVAAVMGGLVWFMLWIWENDRRRLYQLRLYAAVATLVLMIAVAAEHQPQYWLSELHAKVSVVYVLLAALSTAAVSAVLLAERAWPTECVLCRGLRAALAMTAAAVVAVVIFPNLLLGPLAADGAGTSAWHTDTIADFRPLWPVSLRNAAICAMHLGLPTIAAWASVVLMRRRPAPERKALAVCLLGLMIYVPLAMAQVRWSNYVQIIMVLPLLLAVREIMESRLTYRVIRSTALLGAPAMSAMLLGLAAPKADAGEATTCDKGAMLRYLAQQDPDPGRDILLTYVSDGPEVIWNSRYRVVGANYLFNTGFGQTVEAFKSESDDLALRLITERGANLVLVCKGYRETWLYEAPAGTSFHDRLVDGEAPAWLESVSLPEHLVPYRMYRTVNR